MPESTKSPAEVLGAGLKSPAAFDQWRKSGAYLPEFMRDFHDQKDLFKAMQDVVERSNEKHGGHRALNATWTDYHIYTVDIFLWVLAAHGYTLQRSRQRFGFAIGSGGQGAHYTLANGKTFTLSADECRRALIRWKGEQPQ